MKNKKKFAGIIIAGVIVMIAVVAGILAYNSSDSVRLRKQLDLGNRYCNAALYSRRKKHFIFDGINTVTALSFR